LTATLTWAAFRPLTLELAVLAVTLLVFTADLLLGRDEKRGLGALTAMGLAAVLGLSFVTGVDGVAWGGAYVADATGLYLKQALLLAALLGSLGSIDHVDAHYPSRGGEHYLLMLFSLTGMMLLTGAQDLLLWVVAFELAGVPLYALAGLHKRGRGPEAALKLYLTGAASSAVMLYGVSLLWGMSGSTAFADLAAAPAEPLFVLGVLITFAGVGFKVGAVPFHLWMAATYQGAPAPTVAFMSVAPKVAAVGALVRLYLQGLGGAQELWSGALLILAAVTMVVGNLSALPQTDARRLLALSGVGHVGLMLLALAVCTPEALGALLFYAPAYVVSNMGAFIVVSAVVDQAPGGVDSPESGRLSVFAGLSQRSPGVGLAMLLFLLSLAGIPFVVGFWAKILLLWAAWKAGQAALVVLGALLSVAALFYYLRLGRSIYMADPGERGAVPMGLPTRAAIGACAALVVLMGLYPAPFIEQAMEAARVLLG